MIRLLPVLLLLAAVAMGCAHYGFADSDGERADEAGLPVWTVAAPAHEGLDGARLTRTLVDALEQGGVRASWEPEAGRDSVRCTVEDTQVSGFGDALFATAEVACDVGADGKPGRHFSSSGRFNAASRTDQPAALARDHAAVQEAAALDALERLAAQISRWRLEDAQKNRKEE
ncbi:MAG: hypothetical protein ACLFVJ_17355 [Persicimonas sp.]